MVQAVSFDSPKRPLRKQKARATMSAVLPPKFNGLIGVYPQTPFRPDFVETAVCDGVLLFVDGRAVPLDGTRYRIDRDGRALAIGSLLAAHVVNERDVETPIEIVFRGESIELGGEVVSGSRLGPMLVPIDEPPATDDPDAPAVPDAGSADAGSTDDEPSEAETFGAAELSKREAVRMVVSQITEAFLVPMVVDLLAPEPIDDEPDEPDELGKPALGAREPLKGAFEELHITEVEGVGAVPPPPGDGWHARDVYYREKGIRCVWRRSARMSQG